MEIRRLLVVMLFASALLSVGGCGGTTRTIDENFPAARDWFEGAPGSIAVLPGDYIAFLQSSPEAAPDGAATGSNNGATNTTSVVVAGCGSDPVSGCSDGGLAAPLGTLVESINGSETTGNWSIYGTASLKQANEHLKHSLANRRPQLLVSHAVVSRIRARTAYDAQLKAFRGHPEEFVPEGPFNGLVEIELTKFRLTTDGPFDETVEDPRVALEIGVRANVYSMREGEFVPEARGRWEYLGATRRLSDLIAENGRLLNEELERAAGSLAKRIVN